MANGDLNLGLVQHLHHYTPHALDVMDSALCLFFCFCQTRGKSEIKNGGHNAECLPTPKPKVPSHIVLFLFFYSLYSILPSQMNSTAGKRWGKQSGTQALIHEFILYAKIFSSPSPPTHTHIQCAAGLWRHGGKSILYQRNPAFTVELSGCSCNPSEPLNTN